ncbi:MAG TPA: helix-turn-helix transcriptional regulator [Streptosporangiaceae bacterium]|nr:helix-turn-helix transcriptional regulator [Streptosporangiaceae bacterium]
MEGGRRTARRRAAVAAQLRQLRRSARRSVEQAAEALDCPVSRVRQIEDGEAALRVGDARQLLDLYQVTGDQREALLGNVRELGERSWWYPYTDIIDETFETQLILEDEATLIRTHQPNLVPGLLQTERYAWELIANLGDVPLETVERRAALRGARQRILDRDGLRMVVVLDEAALRRPVGGPSVMREQYARLAEAAGSSGVSIRVVPFHAGSRPAADSAFHIFEFGDEDPPVVQVELLDRVQFVQHAREVDRYRNAFEEALNRALDAERSRDFLADLATRG